MVVPPICLVPSRRPLILSACVLKAQPQTPSTACYVNRGVSKVSAARHVANHQQYVSDKTRFQVPVTVLGALVKSRRGNVSTLTDHLRPIIFSFL